MGGFILVPVLIVGLFILLASFFTVKQQTAAIVERFGKFQSMRHSGLQLKIPLIDRIAGRINLKIQQLDVIRPSPMWLWILLLIFGLLIQRIDIKKRKHLKDVKEGVVFDPKLSPSHTSKKKEKGLNKYVQKEAWHSDI